MYHEYSAAWNAGPLPSSCLCKDCLLKVNTCSETTGTFLGPAIQPELSCELDLPAQAPLAGPSLSLMAEDLLG